MSGSGNDIERVARARGFRAAAGSKPVKSAVLNAIRDPPPSDEELYDSGSHSQSTSWQHDSDLLDHDTSDLGLSEPSVLSLAKRPRNTSIPGSGSAHATYLHNRYAGVASDATARAHAAAQDTADPAPSFQFQPARPAQQGVAQAPFNPRPVPPPISNRYASKAGDATAAPAAQCLTDDWTAAAFPFLHARSLQQSASPPAAPRPLRAPTLNLNDPYAGPASATTASASKAAAYTWDSTFPPVLTSKPVSQAQQAAAAHARLAASRPTQAPSMHLNNLCSGVASNAANPAAHNVSDAHGSAAWPSLVERIKKRSATALPAATATAAEATAAAAANLRPATPSNTNPLSSSLHGDVSPARPSSSSFQTHAAAAALAAEAAAPDSSAYTCPDCGKVMSKRGSYQHRAQHLKAAAAAAAAARAKAQQAAALRLEVPVGGEHAGREEEEEEPQKVKIAYIPLSKTGKRESGAEVWIHKPASKVKVSDITSQARMMGILVGHDRENPLWTPRHGDGKEGVYLVALTEDCDVQILLGCEDEEDEPRRGPCKKHHVPALYYHLLPALATSGKGSLQRPLEAGSKPLAPRGPLDVSSAYFDLRVAVKHELYRRHPELEQFRKVPDFDVTMLRWANLEAEKIEGRYDGVVNPKAMLEEEKFGPVPDYVRARWDKNSNLQRRSSLKQTDYNSKFCTQAVTPQDRSPQASHNNLSPNRPRSSWPNCSTISPARHLLSSRPPSAQRTTPSARKIDFTHKMTSSCSLPLHENEEDVSFNKGDHVRQVQQSAAFSYITYEVEDGYRSGWMETSRLQPLHVSPVPAIPAHLLASHNMSVQHQSSREKVEVKLEGNGSSESPFHLGDHK